MLVGNLFDGSWEVGTMSARRLREEKFQKSPEGTLNFHPQGAFRTCGPPQANPDSRRMSLKGVLSFMGRGESKSRC